MHDQFQLIAEHYIYQLLGGRLLVLGASQPTDNELSLLASSGVFLNLESHDSHGGLVALKTWPKTYALKSHSNDVTLFLVTTCLCLWLCTFLPLHVTFIKIIGLVLAIHALLKDAKNLL